MVPITSTEFQSHHYILIMLINMQYTMFRWAAPDATVIRDSKLYNQTEIACCITTNVKMGSSGSGSNAGCSSMIQNITCTYITFYTYNFVHMYRKLYVYIIIYKTITIHLYNAFKYLQILFYRHLLPKNKQQLQTQMYELECSHKVCEKKIWTP